VANEQTSVPIQAAARLIRVSVGQLDAWARTGVVRPSQTQGEHLYSLTDLRKLRAVKRLLDAGVSLEHVREGMTRGLLWDMADQVPD
jgi:DNA-binding transcriptional MerR regulator